MVCDGQTDCDLVFKITQITVSFGHLTLHTLDAMKTLCIYVPGQANSVDWVWQAALKQEQQKTEADLGEMRDVTVSDMDVE